MHRSVLRGIVLIAIAGAVIAVLLLIPSPKQKKQHPPNNDPWLLVSHDPDLLALCHRVYEFDTRRVRELCTSSDPGRVARGKPE